MCQGLSGGSVALVLSRLSGRLVASVLRKQSHGSAGAE
jgi:hypothetical protein